MTGMNIQDMAKSAVGIYKMLQQIATETVGLDCLWCRATPVPNSEDIILHEYTLMNVGLECPKVVKVITSQSDYNPGNFTVDLFNISYDAPLEVNVVIEDWQNVFGVDTMPQKGDVVYIETYNKLYEVKSSTVMYTAATNPMYFKCSLAKYTPKRENQIEETLADSIAQMTVSEETLFGKEISNEVADAVVEVETSYNRTTAVDPMKNFDMSSIVVEDLYATNGNMVSPAYYDMMIADKPVTYNVNAIYSTDLERKHWIFSCWFRINEDPTATMTEEKPLRIFTEYSSDKSGTYFKVSSQMKLSVGDTVMIRRGNLIIVTGTVCEVPCEKGLFVKIPTAQMNKANRQLTGWYKSGTFKILRNSIIPMFSSIGEGLSISVCPGSNSFDVQFSKLNKSIASKKSIDFSKWGYIAIDFSDAECRLVYQQIAKDGRGTIYMDSILDQTFKHVRKCADFECEGFIIEPETLLQIRNIRLYENEYPMEDTYKADMMSAVTRNASKLILVDSPNVPDDKLFYTPVR